MNKIKSNDEEKQVSKDIIFKTYLSICDEIEHLNTLVENLSARTSCICTPIDEKPEDAQKNNNIGSFSDMSLKLMSIKAEIKRNNEKIIKILDNLEI